MTRFAFDLYPRDDPGAGARIVRFTQLKSAEYRKDANGTGSGSIELRGTSTDAAFIDPAGLQYVRVVLIKNDLSEITYGGFFLDKGDFAALTETSTKLLKFTGAGPLSVLQRAIAAQQSYIGADYPLDGEWRWSTQTGGEILDRMVREAQAVARPQAPLSMVTHDFDGTDDSAATPWPITDVGFRFPVGRDLLELARQLMALGLFVDMDGDFGLHAWVTRGTDRTGLAWGAGVVRFQAPSAATVATGNIKSEATRGLAARLQRSDMLVGSPEVGYDWVSGSPTLGLQDIDWEGFFPTDSQMAGMAGPAIAEAQLAARDAAGDTVRLRTVFGESPSTGFYAPGVDYDVADTVTLHSGTGTWDWDETPQFVNNVTCKLRDGGDWDVFVDLGSRFQSIESRAFAHQPVGAHTHPPNPRFCRGDSGSNRLLALAAGSIKVSSTSPTFVKTRAVDGSLADPDHWSAEITQGVDEEWWAGDLGAAQQVGSYRILQGSNQDQPGGGYDPDDAATEMRIYGSNDAAAWAWLPSGKLVADPAANGWTLIATDMTLGPDTGPQAIPSITFRYWLLRAAAGPAAGTGDGWNVQEFILIGGTCTIEDIGKECAQGTSGEVPPCDHVHAHGYIDGAGPWHDADGIAETVDGDVQTALDNLRDAATSGRTTQRDISGNHRYPLWAHRGDIGSADSYPEQTIEALRQAILKGCEGAECDFWPSSEGTFYSMHDVDVNRTTNGTGNVSSKTDAQMDALVIDGGFGYDAGRHAALNLAPPTLAAVIDALRPYDGILKAQIKFTVQADIERFAQEIIDNDYLSRTIIEVNSHTFAGYVKAISPALTTMVNSAASGDDDSDWGSYEASGITNLAYSTSRAPKRIGAYVSIDDYGLDESSWFQNAFDRGASSFQTNDVDAALELRRALLYGDATAADHIADTTDAHDASSVSIVDAGGYFTGTQVEAALQELGDDVAAGSDTSGELLISDTPSTPLVFADILQNEAQNDLLYEG